MTHDEMLAKLTDHFTQEGKLIEVGWISLRMMAVSPDASALQLEEMRTAFFAGAQHLLASIMSILDPESEPTDADLHRMAQIDKELREFITEFAKKYNLPPSQ